MYIMLNTEYNIADHEPVTHKRVLDGSYHVPKTVRKHVVREQSLKFVQRSQIFFYENTICQALKSYQCGTKLISDLLSKQLCIVYYLIDTDNNVTQLLFYCFCKITNRHGMPYSDSKTYVRVYSYNWRMSSAENPSRHLERTWPRNLKRKKFSYES